MEDPVWRFHPDPKDTQVAQSLMKYTNQIIGSVWTNPGYLLIDSPWEEHVGDLKFDPKRFQVYISHNYLIKNQYQYIYIFNRD
jgi:hypothetical protein